MFELLHATVVSTGIDTGGGGGRVSGRPSKTSAYFFREVLLRIGANINAFNIVSASKL